MNCDCKEPSDVFNGVCGSCLMPLNGVTHNSTGKIISDKRKTEPIKPPIMPEKYRALEIRVKELEAELSVVKQTNSVSAAFKRGQESANAELSRKLAKAVEQRNQMTATFWANCDYLTAAESEKRYDDQISELDEELNGDK